MKVYISGPISGTTDFVERFKAAEKEVSKVFPGSLLVNPVTGCKAHGLTGENTWEEFMDVCLYKLMPGCTHLFMMENWEKSVGARVEYYVGKDRGLGVL